MFGWVNPVASQIADTVLGPSRVAMPTIPTAPMQNGALFIMGLEAGMTHYTSKKLHSFEKGTLENRTPRSAVTRRLPLGLTPMPLASS